MSHVNGDQAGPDGTHVAAVRKNTKGNALVVSGSFNYININDASDHPAVKTGKGVLHAITVNKAAAGAIEVYDALTSVAPAIATLKASIAEGTYVFDVAFTTGLSVKTNAAGDITVSYL